MPRKIRFRQQRIYELRIVIVFVLFTAVLLFGLLAVDVNKSYIFYGEPRFELFQMVSVDSDVYQVSILNEKYTLNLKYVKRDISKIKAFLKK